MERAVGIPLKVVSAEAACVEVLTDPSLSRCDESVSPAASISFISVAFIYSEMLRFAFSHFYDTADQDFLEEFNPIRAQRAQA